MGKQREEASFIKLGSLEKRHCWAADQFGKKENRIGLVLFSLSSEEGLWGRVPYLWWAGELMLVFLGGQHEAGSICIRKKAKWFSCYYEKINYPSRANCVNWHLNKALKKKTYSVFCLKSGLQKQEARCTEVTGLLKTEEARRRGNRRYCERRKVKKRPKTLEYSIFSQNLMANSFPPHWPHFRSIHKHLPFSLRGASAGTAHHVIWSTLEHQSSQLQSTERGSRKSWSGRKSPGIAHTGEKEITRGTWILGGGNHWRPS